MEGSQQNSSLSYTHGNIRNDGHARPVLDPFQGDSMRILCGIWLAVALCAGQSGKIRKDFPQGIKTPGVQIPFASLKADAELSLAPRWMVFSESVLIPNKAGGLERLDAKTNKLVDPLAGPQNFCGGAATGFSSLWIPDCGTHSLVRLDANVAADPKA